MVKEAETTFGSVDVLVNNAGVQHVDPVEDFPIEKWDQILELDPGNQKAKLERERAVELKKKMSDKFGTK